MVFGKFMRFENLVYLVAVMAIGGSSAAAAVKIGSGLWNARPFR
mgnify:CR=1 FL=1